MSTLRVDNLRGQTADGKNRYIIQTVQSIKRDSSSTTSTSPTDTGLEATITPTYSSSKILINSFCGIVSYSNNNIGYLLLARVVGGTSSYPLITDGGGLGETNNAFQTTAGFNFGVEDDRTNDTMVLNYLDSPSTTSAVTYKIQMQCHSSGTFQFNKWLQDNNKSGVAFLTLQEIAQ